VADFKYLKTAYLLAVFGRLPFFCSKSLSIGPKKDKSRSNIRPGPLLLQVQSAVRVRTGEINEDAL